MEEHMRGVTVNLMKKTRLEYSHLTGTTSTTLIVKPAIKTGRFYEVYFWVRVHEKNLASANQTILFGLYNTLPTKEDLREFSEARPFLDLTMTNGSMAPDLLNSSVGTGPGPYLKFSIVVTQASAPAILYAQVSAALILRES